MSQLLPTLAVGGAAAALALVPDLVGAAADRAVCGCHFSRLFVFFVTIVVPSLSVFTTFAVSEGVFVKSPDQVLICSLFSAEDIDMDSGQVVYAGSVVTSSVCMHSIVLRVFLHITPLSRKTGHFSFVHLQQAPAFRPQLGTKYSRQHLCRPKNLGFVKSRS